MDYSESVALECMPLLIRSIHHFKFINSNWTFFRFLQFALYSALSTWRCSLTSSSRDLFLASLSLSIKESWYCWFYRMYLRGPTVLSQARAISSSRVRNLAWSWLACWILGSGLLGRTLINESCLLLCLIGLIAAIRKGLKVGNYSSTDENWDFVRELLL